MNIVVIVKRSDALNVDDKTISIDLADRMAIESAVKIKERSFMIPTTVTALCIAPAEASHVIRDCFSLGVDSAYLLDDPIFETVDLDGLINVLSKGIKKIGTPEIVMMGANSTDQVLVTLGKSLADVLNYKYLSGVDNLEGQDKRITAKLRKNQDRTPVDLPSFVNLSADIEYQFSKAKMIMRLYKKEVKMLNARDIEFV